MDNREIYTLVSYNCKNVKRSVDSVRDLCQSSDLIALQETWLLPHDISFLDAIDREFCATGVSAVDTSAGMLRGRPHGGVALLWKRAIFQNVSVLQCNNSRVCGIKIMCKDRPIIVLSVYMPVDCVDNLAEFTDCLGTISALIDELSVESVFILGDFNAHPNGLFYNELINYCDEQKLSCIDINKLGSSSDTYTFVSEAHASKRWLDPLSCN